MDLAFQVTPSKTKDMKKSYYWKTKTPLYTNETIMQDFIENHLNDVLPGFEVTYEDETFITVKKGTIQEYEIHISGNGDFTHHKVEIIQVI